MTLVTDVKCKPRKSAASRCVKQCSIVPKDCLLFIALGDNVIDGSRVLDAKKVSHDGLIISQYKMQTKQEQGQVYFLSISLL